MPESVYYTRIEKYITTSIENKKPVYQVLEEFIKPKTPKSLRVYSKHIKDLANKYKGNEYFSEEDYNKVLELLSAKSKSKVGLSENPEIKYDSYFEKALEYLLITRNEEVEDFTKYNVLFLLPLIAEIKLSDILKIKLSQVSIDDCMNGKLMKIVYFDEKKEKEINLNVYLKKYGEVYETALKKLNEIETDDDLELISYGREINGIERIYFILGNNLKDVLSLYVKDKDAFEKSALKYLQSSIKKQLLGDAISIL